VLEKTDRRESSACVNHKRYGVEFHSRRHRSANTNFAVRSTTEKSLPETTTTKIKLRNALVVIPSRQLISIRFRFNLNGRDRVSEITTKNNIRDTTRNVRFYWQCQHRLMDANVKLTRKRKCFDFRTGPAGLENSRKKINCLKTRSTVEISKHKDWRTMSTSSKNTTGSRSRTRRWTNNGFETCNTIKKRNTFFMICLPCFCDLLTNGHQI